MMSVVLLALCISGALAKIPNVFHQYANGEDEIANIIQLNPRRPAVDLPSIECEQRIGYDDRCSANFTNISVSRNSQSAGHTIAIECPLCAKTGSGPVLVGVGREDGLGQTLQNILFHLATAWNHSFRFGGFLRHEVEAVKNREPNFYETLSAVLGFDYKLLHPRVEPQKFGTCLHGCSGAKRIYEFSGTKPNDVLLDVVLVTDVLPALTPSFVHAWRAISGVLATPANYFKQPGYHIAVHVRRGDVTHGSKLIADDHIYINVARTVQAMLPKAHVHIFSTTFSHITNRTTYDASHFDIYKKHGFQVHLDNPDIDDLTHLAQADVLICSQNSDNARFRDIRYRRSNGTLNDCELDVLRHCLETTVLKTKPSA